MILKQTSFFRNIIILFIVLFNTQLGFAQFDIPKEPTLETSVYDYAAILNNNEANYLEQKLIKYADTTSTQIVIATVKTLNGNDISLVATNWAHKWKIGEAEEDNGIFILVASEDRKIDISTGYGIEYRLTDLMAERILNRIILPEFKQGDYFSGLDKGIDAIISALKGEFKAPKTRKKKDGFPAGLTLLLGTMFFIFILSLIAKGRKDDDDDYKGGKRSRGLSPFETIILSSGGRSYGGSTGSFGGGGYSGSGGGFSGGFGGGSFGGGGASGGW